MAYEYLDTESFELTYRGYSILASIRRIGHLKHPEVFERMQKDGSRHTGIITFSDSPEFTNERGGCWNAMNLSEYGFQLQLPVELNEVETAIARKLLPQYLSKHGVLPEAEALANLGHNGTGH